MNNSFSVEKKVFEVLPDYCVGVIRTSIPNKEGAANAVSELFRKELQRFFHQSQGVALRETKNISAYRSALQKAGIQINLCVLSRLCLEEYRKAVCSPRSTQSLILEMPSL